MEIKEINSRIENYQEPLEKRKYNRLITKNLENINQDECKEILHFQDDVYLVYLNLTFLDEYERWKIRLSKLRNS